jgi:hypothetical protein
MPVKLSSGFTADNKIPLALLLELAVCPPRKMPHGQVLIKFFPIFKLEKVTI